MFKKIHSSFFSSVVARAGIASQVHAAQILIEVERWLIQECGKGVERFAIPSYVKQGYLYITITHPAIAEDIHQKEEALLQYIRGSASHEHIRGVRFIIRKEV